ncbi:hypothetical protein NVP1182O_17 [Vibrio phage 1.182.O._10N.286.46.E1]|nr:hypothetical protein NVP1182O_17 [Vibrio phage 1.182.O._10N.286.46.E1]
MIKCSDAIKQATGKDYEINEIDEFIKQGERIKQKVMNDSSISDKTKGITDALDAASNDLVLAAKIEKRNAMINKMRLDENIDFVQSRWDDYGEGIQAILVGNERVKVGSRNSVDAEQKSLANAYRGGLAHDLEDAGLFKLVTSHQKDREIARALAGEKVADSEAVKAAEVISKYQELARRDANKSGAWIKKQEGYITRQTHDVDAISKSTYEDYIQFLRSKLDLERTLEGVDDEEAFFKSIYKALASGVHMSNSPKEITTAFKGNSNLARRMSEGRLLHFKSADDFMDYNDLYGSGDLISGVLGGLESSANSTGLMRKLGTNPENMVDTLYDNLARTMDDPKDIVKLEKTKGLTENYLAEVTGLTRLAGSHMGAKWSSNMRAVQSMSKLGGALLSSISDTVTFAGEVRYQGGSLLSGLGESMQAIGKGRGTVEERKIMANLGVSMDSFLGDLASRWQSGDPIAGLAQKGMNSFFKWNGLTWWTDSMKRAAALGTSNRLYQQSDIAFNNLDAESKRIMKLYGIGEQEWGIVRQSKYIAEDGTGFLTPEMMRKLPDDDFVVMLQDKGLKPSKMRVELLRDEMESKLRNYVSDRTGYAQLESDARARAAWTRGTKRGTVGGEGLRFIAQFKQYPTIFLQRTLGREIKGKAKGTANDAFLDSPLYGVASLFAALTVGGYVAMTAKDMAKGRSPRDPLAPKTWLAAAVQGGGAGIYGDFLFGDMKNRFGGGAVSTFLGPTAGTADQVVDIFQRLRDGDDTASTAFTALLNNTPYMNLFYTRTALDYMILYDVRESLNPGYMRRMERRIMKENEQEFLLPPSKNALRPITR